MTVTLFKKVDYTLNKLLEDIALGEIGLPDIQRPFVWLNSKVRDLFDSMYRGYPIGYVLFWANSLSGGDRQIGTNTKQAPSRLLIVDGQQRLTSLYAVLKGIPVIREDFSQGRIQIAYHPATQKFEVADAATKNDPEWLADISLLWSKETSRNKVVKGYMQRLHDYRDSDDSKPPLSEDEEEKLTESIDQLYDLQNYPITALELSATVTEEQVADVFVRINSTGTKLDQADFILTLMSVFWDEGRAQLEAFSRASHHPSTGAASPYNHFIQPSPDQLLRVAVGLGFRRARLQHVYSILRGKDLETEQFSEAQRTAQFAVLQEAQSYVLDLQHWHEFLKALMRAGYRRADMITSQVTLLYVYVFYLIGKRDYGVKSNALREVIARWFFFSTLTGRYTGSFESTLEQDLARLRDVADATGFVDMLDKIISDTLSSDFWSITLPNELGTSSARTPSLFAYYASLNLLEAKVLFSKLRVAELLDPTAKAKKSALERHHLFPKGHLAKLGISEKRDTNQIANFALVEWSDNIDISAKPPSKYVPQHAERFSASELKDMYYWHALPADWYDMEYSVFLAERRQLIAKVIQAGFMKLYE